MSVTLCERVVDEEFNLICGERATKSVNIKNHAGTVRVSLCPKHMAEHNEKAASIRTRVKK